MGAKDQTQYTTETGGQAKYIKHFADTANATGVNIDLSAVQYEVLRGKTSFIKIFNTGSKTLYVAFDSDSTTIDTSDRSTYNISITSGTPFSEIEINGETSKISLKCASGETSTYEIITW